MEDSRVNFSKMRLRYYSAYNRGVHAASNIVIGDILLEVPIKNTMVLETAFDNPIAQKWIKDGICILEEGKDTIINLTYVYKTHAVQAVRLLYEKKKMRDDPSYEGPYG